MTQERIPDLEIHSGVLKVSIHDGQQEVLVPRLTQIAETYGFTLDVNIGSSITVDHLQDIPLISEQISPKKFTSVESFVNSDGHLISIYHK